MWDLDEEEEGSINELTSDFGSGGGMTLADRTDAAALAQLNQPQWVQLNVFDRNFESPSCKFLLRKCKTLRSKPPNF